MRDCRKCLNCAIAYKDGACWCRERRKIVYWPEASALFCTRYKKEYRLKKEG